MDALRECRAVREFAEAADAHLMEDFHEGFFSLAPVLRQLLETDFLGEIGDTELRRIAADPRYSGKGWEPNSMIVAAGASWQLRVGFYFRNPQFIYSLPYHILVGICGHGSVQVDRYRLPEGLDKSVFDPSIRLAEPIPTLYGTGAVFQVDSRHETVDILVQRPVLAVRLYSSVHETLQWAFDRMTRMAIQGIACNPVDSDVLALIAAATAMERRISEPAMEALSHHSSHFIRWAAIKGMARIAPERAVAAVRRSIHDEHPHVRAAAQSTLARLAKAGGVET